MVPASSCGLNFETSRERDARRLERPCDATRGAVVQTGDFARVLSTRRRCSSVFVVIAGGAID